MNASEREARTRRQPCTDEPLEAPTRHTDSVRNTRGKTTGRHARSVHNGSWRKAYNTNTRGQHGAAKTELRTACGVRRDSHGCKAVQHVFSAVQRNGGCAERAPRRNRSTSSTVASRDAPVRAHGGGMRNGEVRSWALLWFTAATDTARQSGRASEAR